MFSITYANSTIPLVASANKYVLASLSTILLSLLYLIFKCSNFRRLKYRDGCKPPPMYPHKDILLGSDYWFHMRKASRESRWLKQSQMMFQKYGNTYEVCDLGRRMIHTCDLRNIQSVWATDFRTWGLQPLREGLCTPFFDRGLNTVDGDLWTHSRALVAPTFARTEIADLGFLGTHTDRLLEQIPKDGTVIDIQPLLGCLFLDTTTMFLFGESMDSLLPEKRDDCIKFIDSFDACWAGVGDRVRLGPLRFLHHDRAWLDAISYVHARIDTYIDRAVEIANTRNLRECSKRYVLLDEMVRQTSDKDFLRSQILAVFAPARESIAAALSNVLHVLARRPDIYNRLRQEVRLLGDNTIDFEALKSLTYVHWVLNESLRVYPTAAQSYRQALNDTRLPTGGGSDGKSPIFIRKGDTVMASMWGLHQSHEVWGDDVAEFRPERWKGLKPGPTFAPFLMGPRTCPAKQMVLVQEAYVLVRIVQSFEAIESADPLEWTEARRLDFRSKYGVKVRVIPSK